MKPTWRRFAPAGLYLSLLAALVSATLYIVQREWNTYLQISLALIVVGLAIYALLDPEKVRATLTGRQAKYGSNAAILTVAFVGILVVINYLGRENTVRKDLTEDQQNTLAVETLDTLARLPEPVEVQAFYDRLSTETAAQLLDQYKFESDGKLDYRFINPVEDPILANQAGITQDGTLLFKMGARQELVTLVTEREMTAALVRLMSQESLTVYFLTGHGERSISETGNDGYSAVKQVLESKNYTVAELNLLAVNKIPDDAKVIVIAGPDKPVSQAEVEMLQEFLDIGGSLVVMEEPLPLTQFGDAADPLAGYLQQSLGIIIGNDVIIDKTSQQPVVAVANQYGSHPITERLQGMISFFPSARSVRAAGSNPEVTAVELVLTSPASWAETDLAALEQQQANPDEGIDQFGPVPLAVASQNQSGKQRVVVYGDSDFVANGNFQGYGNGDVFVNTIDWATEQEELINLTPKDQIQRVLVPPQRYTMGLILFGSVFLLPGIVLVSGILVFLQRRKRG